MKAAVLYNINTPLQIEKFELARYQKRSGCAPGKLARNRE